MRLCAAVDFHLNHCIQEIYEYNIFFLLNNLNKMTDCNFEYWVSSVGLIQWMLDKPRLQNRVYWPTPKNCLACVSSAFFFKRGNNVTKLFFLNKKLLPPPKKRAPNRASYQIMLKTHASMLMLKCRNENYMNVTGCSCAELQYTYLDCPAAWWWLPV